MYWLDSILIGVCWATRNSFPRDVSQECNERRTGFHDNGCRDQEPDGTPFRTVWSRWWHQCWRRWHSTRRAVEIWLLLNTSTADHPPLFFFVIALCPPTLTPKNLFLYVHGPLPPLCPICQLNSLLFFCSFQPKHPFMALEHNSNQRKANRGDYNSFFRLKKI